MLIGFVVMVFDLVSFGPHTTLQLSSTVLIVDLAPGCC